MATTPPDQDLQPQSAKVRRSGWRETLITVVVALIAAFLLRTYVIAPYYVSGFSMEPTLHNQERLLVNEIGFKLSGLRTGDIVVFHPPLPVSIDFIKRVIGVPGDTVSMVNGQVYINGKLLAEPWETVAGKSYLDHFNLPPTLVKPGYIYVLGDNRAHSDDSRFFGQVPISSVVGQAVFAVWPPSQFGWVPVP
ncbi:MAG: signal peptidase I [Sulfobacillus sp.]